MEGETLSLDSGPFVVLDDARDCGAAFILQDPVDVIVASSMGEVRPALETARNHIRSGRIVAGFLSYEAGAAFETKLNSDTTRSTTEPLVWFGCFDKVTHYNDIGDLLPEPGTLPQDIRANWSYDQYVTAADAVLERIKAGDIYQANLTFPVSLRMTSSPMAQYASLRKRQQAGWGGMVHTGKRWLMSLSPELFFTLSEGSLQARPMKGTAPRAMDVDADIRRIKALQDSSKERAENLMIVDLIRNDFSRISRPGSVKVPELFSIETYPTVHQMTSQITAELCEGKDAIDVLEACFPCGSVTGAPKIRAMEIISDLEAEPRGSYTGSLGIFLPDGSAAFNVLIRTLSWAERDMKAKLNVGSGITSGSCPTLEWRECLSKLNFAGRRNS